MSFSSVPNHCSQLALLLSFPSSQANIRLQSFHRSNCGSLLKGETISYIPSLFVSPSVFSSEEEKSHFQPLQCQNVTVLCTSLLMGGWAIPRGKSKSILGSPSWRWCCMWLATAVAKASLFPGAVEQRGGEGKSPQAIITMRCGEVHAGVQHQQEGAGMPRTGKHTHCYLCELLLCLNGPLSVNTRSVWDGISDRWTAPIHAFPRCVPKSPPLHSRRCLTPTFPGRNRSCFSCRLHPRAGSPGAALLCPGPMARAPRPPCWRGGSLRPLSCWALVRCCCSVAHHAS